MKIGVECKSDHRRGRERYVPEMTCNTADHKRETGENQEREVGIVLAVFCLKDFGPGRIGPEIEEWRRDIGFQLRHYFCSNNRKWMLLKNLR